MMISSRRDPFPAESFPQPTCTAAALQYPPLQRSFVAGFFPKSLLLLDFAVSLQLGLEPAAMSAITDTPLVLALTEEFVREQLALVEHELLFIWGNAKTPGTFRHRWWPWV